MQKEQIIAVARCFCLSYNGYMTTLKNDYIQTMNTIESMKTGINAHRDRFYDFINSGQAEGFADYELSALSTTPSVGEYKVDLKRSTTTELAFYAPIIEWGDYSESCFFMPVAYLDDPAAWEQSVLDTNAAEHKLCEHAVHKAFSRYDATVRKVISSRVSRDNGAKHSERFRDITIKVSKEQRKKVEPMAFYDKGYDAHLDLKTGILYYGSFNAFGKIDNEGNPLESLIWSRN